MTKGAITATIRLPLLWRCAFLSLSFGRLFVHPSDVFKAASDFCSPRRDLPPHHCLLPRYYSRSASPSIDSAHLTAMALWLFTSTRWAIKCDGMGPSHLCAIAARISSADSNIVAGWLSVAYLRLLGRRDANCLDTWSSRHECWA